MKLLIVVGLVAFLAVANGAVEFIAQHFAGVSVIALVAFWLAVGIAYALGVRIERR